MKANLVVYLGLLGCLSARGFVLDDAFKKVRPIYISEKGKCVSKEEASRTPVRESIERGECEPFAQAVGRINASTQGAIYHGVGTLIAPNAILTGAHVVQNCIKKDAKCEFEWEFKRERHTYSISKVVIHPSYVDKEDMFPPRIMRDIAIAFLDKPIPAQITFPHFHMQPELLKNGKGNAFAASANRVHENATGLPTRAEPVRHIMVTELKKLNDVFVHVYDLPKEAVAQNDKHFEMNDPRLNKFIYHPEKDSFLQGRMLPGDSGSPLFGRYPKEGDEIIGVARGVSQLEGLQGHDNWDPVHPFLPWFKEVLEAHGVHLKQYQPGLKALSR